MMTRVIFRRDLSSGWVTSQDGIYQYGVARRDCRQIGPVQLSGDCVCLNGHP